MNRKRAQHNGDHNGDDDTTETDDPYGHLQDAQYATSVALAIIKTVTALCFTHEDLDNRLPLGLLPAQLGLTLETADERLNAVVAHLEQLEIYFNTQERSSAS